MSSNQHSRKPGFSIRSLSDPTLFAALCAISLIIASFAEAASVPIPMSHYLGLPDRAKIVRAPTGSWIWCPSIMKVGAKYHLFVSIIPNIGTWTSDSKIARYEASDLFGPYTYKGIVLQPGGWITLMIHNPKVLQDPVSKKYLLFFIANNVNYIGYAQADSITGPWTISSDRLSGVSMSNPTGFLRSDGSIYLLGRMKADYNGVASSLIRAYSAPRYNGTYTRLASSTNNLLSNNCGVEDPCVWYANNQYHLIGCDWPPYLTGARNGVQYYSNDGLIYIPVSSAPLWSIANFKFSDGSAIGTTRTERPQVVLDDNNKVIALLIALGTGGRTDLTAEESGICIIPVNNYDPNGSTPVLADHRTPVKSKRLSNGLLLKTGSANDRTSDLGKTPVYTVSGKAVAGKRVKTGVYVVRPTGR